MAQEALRVISPVGRVIWGSVYERASQDYDGNKYEDGKGPFQFGLAVLKTDPGINAFLGQLYNQAKAGYASNANISTRIDQEWSSGFSMGLFRFKIKDGDKPNADGTMNPNAKGCWVFTMSTTIPFKCGNAQNIEIDPKTVKRGYYVDVAASIKVNEQTDHTAGIYINPNVVRLLGFGDEITGGVSVEEAFKGHAAPAALPPGASLTPVAPAGGIPGLPPINPQAGQTATGLPGMPGATGLPGSVPNAGIPSTMPGSAPAPVAGAARFDPVTGQPIAAAAPVITGYNPQTGQPIYAAAVPPAQVQMVQTGFDPQTGAPVFGVPPQANATSTTGYPINPATGQPVTPHPGILNPPGQ